MTGVAVEADAAAMEWRAWAASWQCIPDEAAGVMSGWRGQCCGTGWIEVSAAGASGDRDKTKSSKLAMMRCKRKAPPTREGRIVHGRAKGNPLSLGQDTVANIALALNSRAVSVLVSVGLGTHCVLVQSGALYLQPKSLR